MNDDSSASDSTPGYYLAPPPGYPWASPPPIIAQSAARASRAARTKRNGGLALILAMLIGVLGGVARMTTEHVPDSLATAGRNFTTPEAFAELQLDADDSASLNDDFFKLFGSAPPSLNHDVKRIRVGIYSDGDDDDGRVAFVGMEPAKSLTSSASQGSYLARNLRGSGFGGAGEYDAGPLGGRMQCATRSADGVFACAWADASMIGIALDGWSLDIDEAAATTRALRAAAEH